MPSIKETLFWPSVIGGIISSYITIGSFAFNIIASEQYTRDHETIAYISNGEFLPIDDWRVRFIVFLVIATLLLAYAVNNRSQKRKRKK